MSTGLERGEPWMDDGSVVLAVQGKGFRVHRSILSTYSDVFRDMFAIPHPDTVKEDTIDGCPVVYLHDSPADVQIVLKALYDRSYMFFPKERIPTAVLTAFLRLGRKYAIQQLLKEATDRLLFDDHCLLQVSDMGPYMVYPFPRVCGADRYNFEIINIASEAGLSLVVAIAAYCCAIRCPFLKILNGYDEEGTRYTLSPTSQQYCLIAQNYVAETKQVLSGWLAATAGNCKCDCTRRWIEILQTFHDYVNPFTAWEECWDEGLCDSCTGELKSQYERTQIKLRIDFPVRLGLGSWSDLEKALVQF